MNLLAYFVGALLKAVPMGGKRTYVMGGIGILAAVVLMLTGNAAEGGTLLVLSLQAIFQRSGTAALEQSITDSVMTALDKRVGEGDNTATYRGDTRTIEAGL